MKIKEEGKHQESIQSNRIIKNTRKLHIKESQEVSPIPAGGHNTARNRQDSTDINYKDGIVLSYILRVTCRNFQPSWFYMRGSRNFRWGPNNVCFLLT